MLGIKYNYKVANETHRIARLINKSLDKIDTTTVQDKKIKDILETFKREVENATQPYTNSTRMFLSQIEFDINKSFEDYQKVELNKFDVYHSDEEYIEARAGVLKKLRTIHFKLDDHIIKQAKKEQTIADLNFNIATFFATACAFLPPIALGLGYYHPTWFFIIEFFGISLASYLGYIYVSKTSPKAKISETSHTTTDINNKNSQIVYNDLVANFRGIESRLKN
jgi:hypothetical protein